MVTGCVRIEINMSCFRNYWTTLVSLLSFDNDYASVHMHGCFQLNLIGKAPPSPPPGPNLYTTESPLISIFDSQLPRIIMPLMYPQ